MDSKLGQSDIVAMFGAAVEKIRANIKKLSALDSAIGDGDHGTTMVRAMDAVEKAVKDSSDGTLKDLLFTLGQ